MCESESIESVPPDPKGGFFPVGKKVDRIRPRPHSFSKKIGKYRDFYFSFGKKRVLFLRPAAIRPAGLHSKSPLGNSAGEGERKKRGKTDDVWLFNGQPGPKAKKTRLLFSLGGAEKKKEK